MTELNFKMTYSLPQSFNTKISNLYHGTFQMATKNALRPCIGKKDFSEKNSELLTAVI